MKNKQKEPTKTIGIKESTWKKLSKIGLDKNMTHDETINDLMKNNKRLEEQQK